METDIIPDNPPPPPGGFYRVQHPRSYTKYSTQDGFAANGHYLMALSHWLNPGKIRRHLDWSDRSDEPSPFISVFDNLEDARKRASWFEKNQTEGVFIAHIRPRSLRLTLKLRIEFQNGLVVTLPAWESDDGTTFISVKVIRRHFGIELAQKSEWLVLDYIPADIITIHPDVWDFK